MLKKTDLTEAHTTSTYSTLIIIYLLSLIGRLYISSNPKYDEASAYFALSVSSGVGLVIILTFFHWPYETNIDQVYVEPADNENKFLPDNTLMVDEDLDNNIHSEST